MSESPGRGLLGFIHGQERDLEQRARLDDEQTRQQLIEVVEERPVGSAE